MNGCYLIGVPGSGKSTLLKNVLPPASAYLREPVPRGIYVDGTGRLIGAQLGLPHPDYPGTDRLSMAISPKAVQWIHTIPVANLVGEGDRLATVGFLDAMRDVCDRFELLWLDTSPDEAEARCRARGSKQNPSWLAGRATKVKRLVDAFPEVIRIDGDRAPEIVAKTALSVSVTLSNLQQGTGVSPT